MRGAAGVKAGPDDFGPANIGQLKRLASRAREEFEARLPGGGDAAIDALVGAWDDPQTGQPLIPNPPDQNLAPINLGQLKAVAKPGDIPLGVPSRFPRRMPRSLPTPR